MGVLTRKRHERSMGAKVAISRARVYLVFRKVPRCIVELRTWSYSTSWSVSACAPVARVFRHKGLPRAFGWLLASSPHISAHSIACELSWLQYFGVQT